MTLIGKLPLSVVQLLGSLIGNLLLAFRIRMALVCHENIRRCFPELTSQDQQDLTRQSLQETSKSFLESAISWTASKDICQSLIYEVEGKSEVDTLIAKGNGLIFIIPHLGNWEIIQHYLGRYYKPTHMYQPNRDKSLNTYIQSCRDKTGTHFVPTDNSGIRAQLKALRQGGAIGVMPDQEPEIHTGEFAPFFGIDALTNHLVTGYVAKTGASTIITHLTRLQNGKGFRLTFSVADLDSGSTSESLSLLNQSIERAIRPIPGQYLWSYKRFRTRPQGEIDFYKFHHHPIRVKSVKILVRLFLWLTSLISFSWLHMLAGILSGLTPLLLRRRKKFAAINLKLCMLTSTVSVTDVLAEYIKTGLEVGRIWRNGGPLLNLSVSLENDPSLSNNEKGVLIMTPPLGNREIVMHYLASRHTVTEYYHPNSRTALDDIIRQARTHSGIKLVDHSQAGREIVLNDLALGQAVTLCPDQQPRLRGGLFIPFFSCPALTTLAIPELLRKSDCNLLFGIAFREDDRFILKFIPCEWHPQQSDLEILTGINRQLEKIILTCPCQYRWSDKRFNIRPPGEAKVYSE